MRKLAAVLLMCLLIGSTASAHSRNVEIAAERLVERYPETHILPSVGLGIFVGESGGGRNGGRFYGIVPCARYPRTWDVEDSTDQFLRLMDRYGNVDDVKSWMGQLYVLQSHGYYGGEKDYISYVSEIILRNGFTEFDEKAKRYEKRQKRYLREKKRAEKRKKIQKRQFLLIHDPSLAPYQVRTHRGAIKGGTIRIKSDDLWQFAWLDVVKTKKGDDQVIYTGNKVQAMLHPVVELADVFEEAKG